MRENIKTQRFTSYFRMLCLKDRKAEAKQISPFGGIPGGKGVNVKLQTKKERRNADEQNLLKICEGHLLLNRPKQNLIQVS